MCKYSLPVCRRIRHMTTAAHRLAGFAAALAVLFALGAFAGRAIDPAPPKVADTSTQMTRGDAAMNMSVRGLSVEQNGLRLVVDTPVFTRGHATPLRYRVLEDDGGVLRDHDIEHTKRMHLIVVRRDLTGFQHLHPRQEASGAWVTPLRLDQAGSYRVFADFSRDRTPITLASEVRVDGSYAATPLPAPIQSVDADGYQVRLREPKAVAASEAQLRFQVTRNGEPAQVEQYLGADGHLVALRQGDLGFLHVHPVEVGERRTIRFGATFPTTARYRLFLQFKVAGEVHTAAFTQVVR